MIYNWFKIFNRTEFLALNLTSKLYTLELDGVGLENILVTHGNFVGVKFRDVFLAVNLNSKNPFEFDGYAIYLNNTTNDVYVGILVP